MMQQLRQYPGSEPSSSREPRVPRIPDRRLRQGEVETSEFSESSETSENIFPRFSAPSFPFCTSLYVKRKTRRWKNSEFDQNALRPVYIDQNNFNQSIKLFRARSSYTINQPQGGTP